MKVKILVYAYEYPPLGGGVGNVVGHVLEEFGKSKDLEVDLVTSAHSFKYSVVKKSENVRVHFLPVRIGLGRNLHSQKVWDMVVYSLVAYVYSWYLLFVGKRFDLTHFIGYPGGLVSWLFVWNWPYIVTFQGIEVPGYNLKYKKWYFLYKWVAKVVWKKASAVTVVSGGMGRLARRTLNGLKFEVIPNGVNVKEFYPVGESRKNKKFTVTAGGTILGKIKGLDYLIRGFAKYADDFPDSELVLVGDGDEKDNLKKISEEEGVGKKVKFVGRKSKKYLKDFLPRCHALCLPSLNEGMSNAVLEGMACGLPVVLTKTGGTEELFDGNGILVAKKNSWQIAKALTKLRKNKKMRIKMGRESRKKAKSFDWPTIAKQYKDLYSLVARM